MRGAKLALVPLSVPWGVLPRGIRVGFALYFYEVGSLDQRVRRLRTPRLGR